MVFLETMFPIVHAVTDSGAVTHPDFLERATSIMRALGSRGALHLRSSRTTGRRFYELAEALAEVQKKTGCWLIVNDRVDIAAAVHANGAQLASHSLRISEARRVSPNLALGISVHSVEEAVEAEEAGAAWCVAGTVFETPSHRGRVPARVEFIQKVAAAVKIPVIAIGGIRPEDVPILKRAGAHGVATIRGAVWGNASDDSTEEESLMETRLPLPLESGFLEPVTRYISAYDSDAGSGGDHQADGERSAPEAGEE